MLSDFFGNLSLYEIIATLLGIIGGIYALRGWFWPAKINLKLADSIDLMIERQSIRALELACIFDNRGGKTGVIQRMQVNVQNPKNETRIFYWSYFFNFQESGNKVKIADPHAIAVRQQDVEIAFIHFKVDPKSELESYWVKGEYEFEVLMWVNAKSPQEKPKSQQRFRAVIPDSLSREVVMPVNKPFYFKKIEISDWDAN